jgi:ech hydrogenase subunit D
MIADTVSISVEQIVGACARMKAEGRRFVTMTCTATEGDKLDLLYHFDKDFKLEHLRLSTSTTALLPSISGVYYAAFLVENEIQDLFGLRFTGLAIDYKHTLYLDEEVVHAPFCKYSVEEKQ